VSDGLEGPNELFGILASRVSLVKRPANRRRFLLLKEDSVADVETELLKGLHHHLEILVDLLGLDDGTELRAKLDALADLMDAGGDQAVMQVTNFLYATRELKRLLDETFSKQGEEARKRQEVISPAAIERKPLVSERAPQREFTLVPGVVLKDVDRSASLADVAKGALDELVRQEQERNPSLSHVDALMKVGQTEQGAQLYHLYRSGLTVGEYQEAHPIDSLFAMGPAGVDAARELVKDPTNYANYRRAALRRSRR